MPGNGDGSGVELGVERVVGRVEADALDGGELLDVEHVLGVDGVRVGQEGRLAHARLQAAPVDAPEQLVTCSRRSKTVVRDIQRKTKQKKGGTDF